MFAEYYRHEMCSILQDVMRHCELKCLITLVRKKKPSLLKFRVILIILRLLNPNMTNNFRTVKEKEFNPKTTFVMKITI
jgi:hypothetical protein